MREYGSQKFICRENFRIPGSCCTTDKVRKADQTIPGTCPGNHTRISPTQRGQSPANAFMSLNKEICTLEDDTLTVDYEQLQCAQGSLTEPDITATYNTSTSKITFENTAMEGLAYCNADDKTYGVKCPPCRLYKYHYQIFKVLYHESQRFYQRTISRKTQ